jgi:PPM family protein phosphatase
LQLQNDAVTAIIAYKSILSRAKCTPSSVVEGNDVLSQHAYGMSDVGLRRSNNEDVFIIRTDHSVFALGDGIGGAASGEVASRLFAETIVERFAHAVVRSKSDAVNIVKESFGRANDRIFNEAKVSPEHHGMGCTGELLFFYDSEYYLGHVGDSRTYLYRQGSLRQMTRDHSLVQEQIDQGLLTPDEARTHSYRNVLMRAVGIHEVLDIDLIRGETFPDDIFLLCSDGLSDMVDDHSIEMVLSLSLHLEQKVKKLIELAKSAGGYDNVTVVLCETVS